MPRCLTVLGIESSCDDTAAAVVQDDRAILSSVVADQTTLHSAYGVASVASSVLVLIVGQLLWSQAILTAPEPEPVQVAEPSPEPEPPPEPQGPSPEETQEQLAEMIDARSDEMESKLREQYDERIRALQNELVEAEEEKKRIAAQRKQQRIAEEEAAAKEAARLAKLEEERLAAEEAARQAKAEEDARKRAEQQQAAAQPEPPPPPKTKEGDLVTMGAGVSPPQLTVQPEARYPAMAKKLGREADVDVRVLVDERGNVREATLMAQKKAGFGFDEAALDAARAAKYRPATKDGVRVKMYATITISFRSM